MSPKQQSFDWKQSEELCKNCHDFVSITSLVHSPLREEFVAYIQVGHYLEYQLDCYYRTAKISQIAGYFLKLRWIDSQDSSDDRWVHIADRNIHETGYFRAIGRKISLDPPSVIEKLGGSQNSLKPSIPGGLSHLIAQRLRSRFKLGMHLEAIDSKNIAQLKPVTIKKIIGKRLKVDYDDRADGSESFWFHEASPLIHPVGFASLIGLKLNADDQYKQESRRKAIDDEFSTEDASWKMFPPLPHHDRFRGRIKVGMKLEALDHTRPSRIVPATVKKIYRGSFLLIAPDNSNESNWFSCHVTYPYILPVGFCMSHDIKLSPPSGYQGQFSWNEYLEEKEAQRVPEIFFQREEYDHGIEVGQYLEAADSIEPNLICPAKVVEVKGHLIKIHFLGWTADEYDQWVYCQSPDIFPIGWCELTTYHLETPKSDGEEPAKKKLKVK